MFTKRLLLNAALSALVLIAGCKSAPPPAPLAQVPLVAAKKVPLTNVVIHTYGNNAGAPQESYTLVDDGTILRWKTKDGAFYVVFASDNDPCTGPTKIAGGEDYYASSQSAGGNGYYRLKCTVSSAGALKFAPYELHLGAIPLVDRHLPVQPCKGCFIETSDGDEQ